MKALVRAATLGAILVATAALFTQQASAHDPETPEGQAEIARWMTARAPTDFSPAVRGAAVPCANGMADKYPCKNIDLLSTMPLGQIGGGNGNDIWGWVDPSTKREYAIVGRTNGTAFVDVTDAVAPKYLGNLPSHGGTSTWRDMKVYKDHAFIVADQIRGHGMQVFDLTRLREVTNPQTFTEDVHYDGFGPAHNIAINEESGYAYAVGSNTCSAGPHMVDIRNPKQPVNAGCVSQDGYTHDTQCVNYKGPDGSAKDRELCFNSNEDTLTIVDVTDKTNPTQLARKPYDGSAYTHQGWLTADHRYFLLDDELDEQSGGDGHTKTYIFDVASVADPKPIGTYTAPVTASDHNQYVMGGHSYQANYQSGLRVLDIGQVASGKLTEAGFFDIYPQSDRPGFNGAWSVYPYFPSGNVVVNGIEQGLIVVKPNVTR
ncbi:choice-of-anchor B domain-containing protein [Herbihabitans rhizosphaerae]|uniref:Choice-of-anchor B domain-containing protein n=1 Tax=Herbihabitans rhizosphaerae TaxID=1872711 RepID=A0A4Q7KHM6_9PSEU|nr:choice-of-anchor B family protein [Herbihabitans rhizosphaerae]RZS34420.1 choice-of-anchor B domain-containing protein [Herbihabitans rhizosphaerae]